MKKKKMRYAPTFLQDCKENFQQYSQARILDLFQRKYVHVLTVSLTHCGTFTFHGLSIIFILFI